MSMLYIANWKMNLSYTDSMHFAQDNIAALQALAEKKDIEIVLCSSFPILQPLAQALRDTPTNVGAQDCSPFKPGAYTGQVSAELLTEIDCTYCIVGHSEQRRHCGETNEIVAQKTERLLDARICPIICIGETKEQHDTQQTFAVLEEQLAPIIHVIKNHSDQAPNCVIAYEPVWAIGTGLVPDSDYLTSIFAWIKEHIAPITHNGSVRLVYGGSVNENNAPSLKIIQNIDGLLIGGASQDFQKFQNIVS